LHEEAEERGVGLWGACPEVWKDTDWCSGGDR
jgi:hypothetical protein